MSERRHSVWPSSMGRELLDQWDVVVFCGQGIRWKGSVFVDLAFEKE